MTPRRGSELPGFSGPGSVCPAGPPLSSSPGSLSDLSMNKKGDNVNAGGQNRALLLFLII